MRYEGRAVSASGSPRAILKEAYLLFDFLDEDMWLTMLRARNDMTHIYNSARAEALVEEILMRYIPAFEQMERGLSERYGDLLTDI